jgi:endonuclease III-like uncharacterized protein
MTFIVMTGHTFINLILLLAIAKDSFACDEYAVKLKNLENCKNQNSIVKLWKNSSTSVNDKCEVFSETCVNFKAYSQAFVKNFPAPIELFLYLVIYSRQLSQ